MRRAESCSLTRRKLVIVHATMKEEPRSREEPTTSAGFQLAPPRHHPPVKLETRLAACEKNPLIGALAIEPSTAAPSELVGDDRLDHLRREHALRPQRGLAGVGSDEHERGQALDAELGGELVLLIGVNLYDADAVAELRLDLLELRRDEHARAAPRGVEVDDERRGAILGIETGWGTGRGTTGRVRVGASASWTGAEKRATRVGGSRVFFDGMCVTTRRRGVRQGLTFITSSSSDFVTFWMVPAARIARAAPRPRPRGATRDALASGAATATLLREASDDWRRTRARVPLAARLAKVSAQARMLLFGVDVTLTRRPSDVKSRPVTSELAGCGGVERPSVKIAPRLRRGDILRAFLSQSG